MPADPIPEQLNTVASAIVDSAFNVHRSLGPGLLESVYEACLAHVLGKHGISARRQVTLPVVYDGTRIDAGLRLDPVAGDGGSSKSNPSRDSCQSMRRKFLRT